MEVRRAGGPTDGDAFELPDHVQVYDAGEHGDASYVVLELADERTLRSIVEGPVDHHAATKIVPLPDGTTVMPAPLAPPPPAATPGPSERPPRRRPWLVLGAIVLVVVLFATRGGSGLDVPTPTTQSGSLSSQPPPTTSAPPTSAPPTTASPPPAAHPDKGKGHQQEKLTAPRSQVAGGLVEAAVAHRAVEVVDLLADAAHGELLRVLLGDEPLAAQGLDRVAVDPGLGDLGHGRLAGLGLHDVGGLGRGRSRCARRCAGRVADGRAVWRGGSGMVIGPTVLANRLA